MRVPRIIRDFRQASDAKLLVQARRIYTYMVENPNFEQPDPPLAILIGIITEYQTALDAAKHGQPFVAIKNEKKKEVKAGLDTLANSVTATANGDRAKMESSGFKISPAEVSPGLIGPVLNFRVDAGPVPGSVVAQCDGVANKLNYNFQYCLAPAGPDTKWDQVISTDCKITIMTLESLKAYCFRVTAMGTNNQFSYSEIITKGVA